MKNLNSLFFLAFFAGCLYLVSCGSSDDDDPTIDCSAVVFNVSIETTDATCDGAGSITITDTGGVSNYEYSIDGAGFQSSTTFSNVAAGTYTLTIRDENDCTSTVQAIVAGNVAVVSITTAVTDAGCNETNGEITVTATGGNGVYEYSVDGGDFGTSNVFSGLVNGDHTVNARDGDGCSTTRSVTILSGISYSGAIQSIVNNSCAIAGCHVAGTGRADFTSLATVQANASGIKSRTQSGDMPRGGTLTQDEKDRIACWVDDGAPNN